MVTFDCGSLGPPRRPRARGEGGARADRHRPPRLEHRYGTINVIDPSAAASGVRRAPPRRTTLGLPLNHDAAVALYAALVCDTGRFQYETTTPEVFELARELVDVRRADRRACRGSCSRSTGSRTCKLLGEALANAELVVERRFVWTAVTQDMLDAPRRHPRRGRGPHRHRAAHHARPRSRACSRRRPTARVRVSLRSLGDVDVCQHRRRSTAAAAIASRPGSRVDARRSTRVVARILARRSDALRRRDDTHDGLVVVDKPAGWTSHDVVAQAAQGRTGNGASGTRARSIPTPPACCSSGSGARRACCGSCQETTKAYRGACRVRHRHRHARRGGRSARPATDDAVTRDEIERARACSSSATSSSCRRWCRRCKIGGRRLHELAREGKEVERAPRHVRIDRFDIEDVRAGRLPGGHRRWSSAAAAPTSGRSPPISVSRSAGARTSATLRRLRVGSFGLDEAHRSTTIARRPEPRRARRRRRRCAISNRSSSTPSRRVPSAHGMSFTAPRSPSRAGADAGSARGRFAVVDDDGDAARGLRAPRRRA